MNLEAMEIIRKAEADLKMVGVSCNLKVELKDNLIEKSLIELFKEACSRWNVTLEWVCENGSRKNDRPIMRKILWMLGKKNYADGSYSLLARIVGVYDHAGVIKGIKTGKNWLSVNDSKFMNYYDKVKDLF